MSTTSITLTLDKRRPRKDGSFPIVFCLAHQGKTRYIASNHIVKLEDWNAKKREVKSSFKGTESPSRLNNNLTKRKGVMADKITKLSDQDILDTLSIGDLKKRLTGQTQNAKSFFGYMQGLIDDMIKAETIGNARVYDDTLRCVKAFRKNRDFGFHELSLDFIKKFETWYLTRNDNGKGGLSVRLRTIRAAYNKAVKDGLADKARSPFNGYSIQNAKPRKRAIFSESIKRIINLHIEPGTALERDRTIFILSIYLRGIPYADLAHLKWGNIIDGRIHYARQKNDEPISIKIPEQAVPLIDYFDRGTRPKDGYILPVIKHDDPQQRYKDVLNARTNYNNRSLTTLAQRANIEENLTSYVARHSFATMADDLGVPLTAISQMLGHRRISTTQSYLASLRKNRLDDFQEQVLDGL